MAWSWSSGVASLAPKLDREYRPWQPNRKFLTVDIPQFGNLAIFLPLELCVKSLLADFRRSKTAVLTNLEALNFDFLGISHLKISEYFKLLKLQSFSTGPNGSFWGFKISKIDLMENLSGRKILKFAYCVFPIWLPMSVLITLGKIFCGGFSKFIF